MLSDPRKRFEVALILTLGWLALLGTQLAQVFTTTVERVERFDRPALVATRMLERPLEVYAALLHHPAARGLSERGDGPLGLERSLLEGLPELLVGAADDVRGAANAARESAEAGQPGDEARDRAAHLEREAAAIAAHACVLADFVGVVESDSTAPVTDDTDAVELNSVDLRSRVEALLALDAELAAATRALVERSRDPLADIAPEEIPAELRGLPELLLLERTNDLVPSEDWAATRAVERAAPVVTLAALGLGPALFGLFVLLFTRRLVQPHTPLSGRVPLVPGWIAFVAGQLGFGLVGSLVALAIHGLTGVSVLVASVPIVLAALWSVGFVRGAPLALALGAAGERLGVTGSWRSAPLAIAAGVCTLPLIALGPLVFASLAGDASSIWSNPYFDVVLEGGLPAWRKMALEAGVWAPIFEEIAFRGVLFAALRSRLSFAQAALATSLAFAAPHPYDLVGALVVAWISLVMCWLYERTGSLVACMAAHSAYNLLQLSLMLTLL
jgi:membrane protease YdiL (CAAX protease family)